MITWLAGVIYPDDLGEVGMLLHNGSKESYFWNPGDSLGHHLVLPCLRVNVNIATKKKKKKTGQTLSQKWKFGSLYQVKNPDYLKFWLKT